MHLRVKCDYLPLLTDAFVRQKAPVGLGEPVPEIARLSHHYTRTFAPMPFGIALFVLVGYMALALGAAKGQDRAACRGCTVDRDSDGSRPNVTMPVRAEASLLASPDSWTVRKRVDEVTVFFTATHGHKFASGLSKEEIRITDDNNPVAKISAFGYERDLPLRLGLLVDTSGSVNPQFHNQQKAAVQFLRQMVRPGKDQAFVLGFAATTTLTQDNSDDSEQLAAGVSALRNGGGTALFDAIHSACDKLAAKKEDGEPVARVLIVLSDGEDHDSRSTLVQAIARAQMQEVTIYTMNTTPRRPEALRRPEEFHGPQSPIMKRLAEDTGGLAFYDMDKHEVTRAFGAIQTEMRNRYVVSYVPVDLKDDGHFHRIQIAAKKSGQRLHIHTRKGYYARLVSSTE